MVYNIKRKVLFIIASIYYFIIVKLNKIKVCSIDETLDRISTKKASIVRFGDGELDIINGKSLKAQAYDPKLAEMLTKILASSENKNLLIAIPEIFDGLNKFTPEEKEFWTINLFKNFKKWKALCKNEIYDNAFISRPYLRYKDKSNCGSNFEKFKDIIKNRELVIVEGEHSRLGVGNDLFDGCRKIERILCPTTNAYKKYDLIKKTVEKVDKEKLIIVSLGPTSKPLIYELYEQGYQMLDLGHIDLEYEWFLKKVNKKISVNNKYVNEVDEKDNITDLKDEKYESEILINLNK